MTRQSGDELKRCPAVSTLQRMIGGKWKIEILFYLGMKDISRFGQLRRCIGEHLGVNAAEAAARASRRRLHRAYRLRRGSTARRVPVDEARVRVRPHPGRDEGLGRARTG
ncbi:MAG: hypothetical protein RR547_06615, partial [Raoultibacter sp.]